MVLLENKKCLCCGADFVTKPRVIPKKFCSEKCRTRYNARVSYEKNKNTKEYKEYRKKIFKDWLDNNRPHFNDLCRERSRLYSRKRYTERVKNNVCVGCGRIKEEERQSKRLCFACSRIQTVHDKEYHDKKKLQSNVPT